MKSDNFASARIQYHQLFLRYPIVAIMMDDKRDGDILEYIQDELKELEMM